MSSSSTPSALTETLTDAMIDRLRREAGNAGDEPTVHCCLVALGQREPGAGGQQWPASVDVARQECATMITAARAMDDEVPLVPVVA